MVADEETRTLYNRLFSLDDRLWEELRKKSIVDVEQNTLIKFDRTKGVYVIPFLNQTYHVDPSEKTVSLGAKTFTANEKFQLQLVLISYLAYGSELPLTGEMVNEKGLKGGTLFFQGPHALRKEPILERYGEDPHAFRELGERFEGSPLDFGDASFTVRVLPKIPVGLILYCKDEEFPAELVITFDSSIESHFNLDVIWALVNVTVGEFMKQS